MARTVTIKSRALANGSVRWKLYFRPALPDGTSLLPLDKYTRASDRAAVEAIATTYRAGLAQGATTPTSATCDAWYDDFVRVRTGKVSTVDTDHKQWLKWISPTRVRGGSTTFGALPIADVTADDVEAVRDVLNEAIDAWEAAGKIRGTGMSYSTAANLWSILVVAMKHASTRKGSRSLRVREDRGNPCDGVPPPQRGRAKRRHWCRSGWINAALASPQNDRAIKVAVAVGIGLHLRPGEQHELRVRDIDFEAGEVRINRAFKARSKTVGETKTDEGVRTVTIPDWLLPLLREIARTSKPNDRVAPWLAATSEHDRPEAFRAFLKHGGAAPAEIFADTATHEMIDFRSVRDTGITLRFLAGERAEVIQREAGHEHIATTLGYAKEVANKGNRYGAASLTLPADLAPAGGPTAPALCAASSDGSHDDVTRVTRTPVLSGKMVARVGFEPTTFGL